MGVERYRFRVELKFLFAVKLVYGVLMIVEFTYLVGVLYGLWVSDGVMNWV